MAWEARLGLKPSQQLLEQTSQNGLNGLGSPSGIETLAFRSHHAGYVHGLNGLGSPSGGRKFSQDWHSWLYESALVFVDVRFVASEEASEYVARREDGD